MPRVIQVIETEISRGEGTKEDPERTVTQYYTLDGEFLAEKDSNYKALVASAIQNRREWFEAGSPLTVGAGQTGKSITVTGWTAATSKKRRGRDARSARQND